MMFWKDSYSICPRCNKKSLYALTRHDYDKCTTEYLDICDCGYKGNVVEFKDTVHGIEMSMNNIKLSVDNNTIKQEDLKMNMNKNINFSITPDQAKRLCKMFNVDAYSYNLDDSDVCEMLDSVIDELYRNYLEKKFKETNSKIDEYIQTTIEPVGINLTDYIVRGGKNEL